MNFLLLVCLACFTSTMVQSHDLVQSQGKRGGRRLCGSGLTKALALVCGGIYNVQFSKRGGGGVEGGEWPFELQAEDFDYEQLLAQEPAWPFLPQESANSLMQKDDYHHHQRFRRSGVVDECCYNSCSYSTLKSYCAK